MGGKSSCTNATRTRQINQHIVFPLTLCQILGFAIEFVLVGSTSGRHHTSFIIPFHLEEVPLKFEESGPKKLWYKFSWAELGRNHPSALSLEGKVH